MIDAAVEPFVREILNSVVAADSTRFERALKAVPDDRAKYSVSLALAIDRTVMSDLHKSTPSEERVKSLANSFAAMQSWYKIEGLPVEDFFKLLANLPTKPIGADAVGLLAFLTAGWLLVAFLDAETPWYSYLDDILNRLDAEPGELP